MRLCGKYLGDNDATCPQLTCIRKHLHEGLCDNVIGDDSIEPEPSFDDWRVKIPIYGWHPSATYVIQTGAIGDHVNNRILPYPAELIVNHRYPIRCESSEWSGSDYRFRILFRLGLAVAGDLAGLLLTW